MKKINLSIVTLVIILIAATSFNAIAQTAQVIRVSKNKGRIVIDGNKNDGFAMGATVCFYSTSGEQIACGKIQQTSESYVTVKINNRQAKQIRNGMEARLSAEITNKEEATSKSCVDDSECGDAGHCIHGKCVSR